MKSDYISGISDNRIYKKNIKYGQRNVAQETAIKCFQWQKSHKIINNIVAGLYSYYSSICSKAGHKYSSENEIIELLETESWLEAELNLKQFCNLKSRVLGAGFCAVF